MPTEVTGRIDPRRTDPFPFYDREIARLRQHLRRLDSADWRAPSHCRGWSVKDVVSHLVGDEVYNEACLGGTIDQLVFSGGLHGWNERHVRARRRKPPHAVLEEWMRRQKGVRRRWGQIGVEGKIDTSVGPYPLRLQVWHLAREYAIHADDINLPVPEREQEERLRWRTIFGLFAAREEGERLDARLRDGTVRLKHRGTVEELDLETFIAFLGNRPQHLQDPEKQKILYRLGARG